MTLSRTSPSAGTVNAASLNLAGPNAPRALLENPYGSVGMVNKLVFKSAVFVHILKHAERITPGRDAGELELQRP
ncbi:MAG: hypothetical protein OXU41_08470, partial [Gammaproteobacteria bacterium]|nr:hypothetical protein [Gammaproteobacteria bacterium]